MLVPGGSAFHKPHRGLAGRTMGPASLAFGLEGNFPCLVRLNPRDWRNPQNCGPRNGPGNDAATV